ncbi:MAG: hypothetical protein KAY65_16355, partial [Planctomycetes bacterium]|nr:hypothetical protein [Planctomycetota bacterium]
MSLRILIGPLVAFGALLVAAEPASAAEQGPRLSDEDMLGSLDPGFPALSQVITLQKRGDISGALSALAAFVRAREEPADFGQKAKRDRNADASRAESVLGHRF